MLEGNKVALLVFDGMAMDQWVQIREHVNGRAPKLVFDESACFAWLPTLTAVSRQALFSGLKPREFADSIVGTGAEPSLWSRFWQDQGLRTSEILYRKAIRRIDQLDELAEALSRPSIKVAGLVVDTIDEIVHGAVLGKRGIASQIDSWCASGFVEQLFGLLLDRGFHVYLTADHGNVEAIGAGRPNQGVIAEARGERVRIYSTDLLRKQSAEQISGTIELPSPALPPDFLPLFAGGRTAFVNKGEPLVAHGGLSVEELIVPFIGVNPTTLTNTERNVPPYRLRPVHPARLGSLCAARSCGPRDVRGARSADRREGTQRGFAEEDPQRTERPVARAPRPI